jgi:hypothetical protein
VTSSGELTSTTPAHRSGQREKAPGSPLASEDLSLSDARRLENALKRQKGGTGFYNMTGLSRS